MSRTVLEQRLGNPQAKRRLDITLSRQCKELVDMIINMELQDDLAHDRPARTKSAVLEMLIRKGMRTGETERKLSQ
jgi:hypothetical protein